MQGPREQPCSLLLVPVLEGRQKFYERLVKPFQCQVGHWQVLLPVCVWIPCPALPCQAGGWIPHIPTGATWAGLQFPASLCDQCCPNDLITGLPRTGHCLVFLYTISQP